MQFILIISCIEDKNILFSAYFPFIYSKLGIEWGVMGIFPKCRNILISSNRC